MLLQKDLRLRVIVVLQLLDWNVMKIINQPKNVAFVAFNILTYRRRFELEGALQTFGSGLGWISPKKFGDFV